jgi:hypothetical protein
MKIQRKKLPYKENTIVYYFTKSSNKCLLIEHDLTDDFGENDTSGSRLKVEIHYQNSFNKNLEEITMDDVPKRVKDVLTYLS